MDYLCCETSHKMLQKYDNRKKKAHRTTINFRSARVCFRLNPKMAKNGAEWENGELKGKRGNYS